MNKNSYVTKILALSSFIISTLYFNMANSGIIHIINENEDDIEIRIMPESEVNDFTYCWKCLGGQCNKYVKHNASLKIPTEAYGGLNLFAVRGTTGGFLFNGECRNLSLSKNYEIHFLNNYIGTSCVSKEI